MRNDPVQRTAVSAGVAFLIFFVISLATGGSLGFAIVGGLICAAIAIAIAFVVRRAKAARR